MDGWVKLWTRATIDAADPPDEEDWCLEMQPLLEVQVSDNFSAAKLMSLVKKNDDPSDEDWYGQVCTFYCIYFNDGYCIRILKDISE